MRARILFSLVLLFVAATLTAEERWYVFSIGETPVGYVSEESDGGRTRTILFARLVRLKKAVVMRFDSTAIEDADGALQSLAFEMLLSKQPTRFEAVAEGNRFRIGDRFIDRGNAVGPSAVVRLTAEKLRVKNDSIEYAVFSPELQRVARVKRTVITTGERVACNGAMATRIEESMDGLPAPRTLWVDQNGVTIADTITGPFGAMSTCRSTREAALAANGVLPADLYEKTLARSNVRLADAAAIDRIVLRITPRDPSQPLPDFTMHNQRVRDGNTVEITRPSPNGAQRAADIGSEFLAPNAIIDFSSEAIVTTAKDITQKTDPLEVALALTKWTADNMSMDAGIVMAPATELIQARKGTCMGYATLLAALSRARGIPSRIVMGYVYYGGIWGGHAWTEMLIDGRWLPFDAAVYAPGVASATRLGVGASSFSDGGGSLNGALMLLFGRVDIDVVEYEQRGRTTRVPRGQQAWRIEGSRYVNPGLGLAIDASGWTIERADSTWPSTLVVAFRRGNTAVEIHEKNGSVTTKSER